MNLEQAQWQRLTRQRWWVLAASCLINLCIGSLYTWSVFATPMAHYLNTHNGSALTAGSLAIVFTVANSVGPITLISGGYFNDRIGPRWVIFGGGVLFGGGFLLCGAATSLTGLILGFGLCCGLAMGLVYGCTVSNSIKLFPDCRGLIGGLVTATYGIGSVVLPPVATSLIRQFGVSRTFFFFGLLFLTVICLGSFLIVRCPTGFVPHGWTPAATTSAIVREYNWREMLQSPLFYVLLLMLTCGAFSGLMIISQASDLAQTTVGLSTGTAAAAVSLLALFNGSGRVLAGAVSDKWGRIPTLQAVFVLSAVALAMLLGVGEGKAMLFFCAISLIGLCFGSFMGIFPGFTADCFGTRHNSVNYGILFIGFAVAGFFGPMGMGYIQRLTGSSRPAFLVAIGLSLSGLLLTVCYTVLQRRPAHYRTTRPEAR